MKSKTTFWGQVGAAASGLQLVGVTGIGTISTLGWQVTELQKEILVWCAFIGFVLAGVAKYAGGVATADAEVVQPEKTEPPKQ